MKKQVLALLAAGAVLSVGMGTGVLTTKIRSFSAIGAGLVENADCDGMAMLKFDSRTQMTSVHVVLHGFLPNTVYGLKLDGDGGGFSDPIAVLTNNGGNGNYMLEMPQDRTSRPTIVVYIWDGNLDVDSIYEVTDDEKRAIGSAL